MGYKVHTTGRDTWSVVRQFDRRQKTVFVTQDQIAAQRVRDELERADKQAFYEGLIIGHNEAAAAN